MLRFVIRVIALSLLFGSPCADAADSNPDADQPRSRKLDDAIAAIKQLGGASRSLGGQWEVEFHLRGQTLTDAGLVHLTSLPDLVWLNLRDTKITDAGLAHLKPLKKLRWLHLERTQIGDDGVAHLAALYDLEYLNLYQTKVSDKALMHLAGLEKLKRLYVWDTAVTDAGKKRLEAARPGLTVVRGVDLSKLAINLPPEPEPAKPMENLKWIAVANAAEAPKSRSGENTEVIFENKSGQLAKVYWVSYGGELKLYGELKPGGKRRQNTYANNSWLITDAKDKPRGYFIVGQKVAMAVIPR